MLIVEDEAQVAQPVRNGAVRALAEMLNLAAPAASERGSALRKLVAGLAAEIGQNDPWDVEVAARLVHLGAVRLAAETADKLYSGTPLSTAEERLAERVPEHTRRILEHVPGLERVVEILSRCRSNYGGITGGESLPLGARMLRIALDYDALAQHGADPAVAVGALRCRRRAYDPNLLDAFGRMLGADADPRPIKQIPVLGLRAGMMLADDVRASNGSLLIARGRTATEQLVTRLWNLGAGSVREPLLVLDA